MSAPYTVKINDKPYPCLGIAFDGCHKIYIIDTEDAMKEAKEYSYTIYQPEDLEKIWKDSCPLRFINLWSSLDSIIEQGWTPEGVAPFGENGESEMEFEERCREHELFDADAGIFVPKIEIVKN